MNYEKRATFLVEVIKKYVKIEKKKNELIGHDNCGESKLH